MRSLYVLGVLLFAASAYANELGTIYDETETDPRNLFNNNTSLSVSFTSLIYGVFVLVALGLLAALLSYFLFGASAADTGYSSYSSYGGNSGYASGRAAELYMMSHMSMVVLLCGLAHSVTGQDFEDGASARFGYSSTNSDNLDNVALDAPSLFLSLAAIAFAVGLFPLIYVFFSDLINATFASKFGDTHGYSRSDSISAGQEYIDQARSASPYATVFDKLSVLDWIAMMEEVYRKFDATSVDCQKRLVCELHQNENTWGSTARKMNDAFGYLQYFELLNLPEDLRMMLEEYLEAANKGRTSQNSCEELFPTCEFSMKSLISKYNGSNSI